MNYVATGVIKSVYTGSFIVHDPGTCPTCKAGQACQYAVEGQWIKIGYHDIEPGQKFLTAYHITDDVVRLQDAESFTYDISADLFSQFIKEDL